jgi:hypothetical protein
MEVDRSTIIQKKEHKINPLIFFSWKTGTFAFGLSVRLRLRPEDRSRSKLKCRPVLNDVRPELGEERMDPK